MTSAHRDLPGFRRLAQLLVDAPAESRSTMRTRTLDGFLGTLEEDLITSLGRKHLQTLGAGRVLIHVDRIIRDDYGGDPNSFWNELASVAKAKPKLKNSTQPHRELLDHIRPLPDNSARRQILALVEANTGWPLRVAGRNGTQAAFEQVHTLVLAADQLSRPLQDPTTLKDFSSRTFQDSHRLDPGTIHHRRLADYLATQAPDEANADDADWPRQILEHYNLFQSTLETTVFVAGHLRLGFQDGIDDRVIQNTRRGLATCLSLQELAKIQVADPAPRLILTIENSAPFTNLLRDPVPDVLLVYTAGNGNAAIPSLLRRPGMSEIPHHHWGDIDVGGFRLLRRLQAISEAQALFMDADAVRAHATTLTPFRGNKRRHIEQNLDRFPPASRAALQACLDLGGWLEQESLTMPLVRQRLMALLGPAHRGVVGVRR